MTVVIICGWRQWRVSVSDGSGGGRDKPLFDINIDQTDCLEQIVSGTFDNQRRDIRARHVTNFFVTVADAQLSYL